LAAEINPWAKNRALPTFQKAVVPAGLTKPEGRHKSTHWTAALLAPNPEWIKTPPNGKTPPDRTDFTRYGNDLWKGEGMDHCCQRQPANG
jgi:hypothetical protein